MTSFKASATMPQRETARRKPGDVWGEEFRMAAFYSRAVTLRYTPPPHAARRNRRTAERRQVHALQRADSHAQGRGGQLSLLHDRAERRRRHGARHPPGAAGENLEVR